MFFIHCDVLALKFLRICGAVFLMITWYFGPPESWIWRLMLDFLMAMLPCENPLLYAVTLGSRFATVHFTTIRFYNTCRVGPSTPDLCITFATPASFLYLSAPLALFRCACFFFFYFSAVLLSWLIFLPTTSIKKIEEKEKSKQLTFHSFLMSSEPWPGTSSTK